MAEAGYYRFPSIHGEDVVFVSEDDLWHVPADGGVARRLTGGIAAVTHPAISPDGKHVAFSGKLEGPAEVYLMPLSGGEPKRITFTGHGTNVVGWDRQGRILFISSWRQPFPSLTEIYAIPPDGGMPEKLPYGWAKSISLHPGGGIVIGRNAADPAIWKRYRGGTEGEIWIDPEGKGAFRKLLTLAGNVSRPMWIGERIFFLSDHEGVGNLYSCRVSGEDLRRHTHHETFYVRNPSTDGRRIVYHAGGDLYLYDPSANETSRIEIVYPSPRPQRRRRFVRGADYLDDFRLDPSGKSLALIARGRAFTVGIREKAFFQHGLRDGVRYRLPTWLSEGKRLLLVSDECGEETLELHHVDPFLPPRRLDVGDIGSPLVIEAAPRGDLVALGNHRCELFLLDLAQERATRIDRSPHGMIRHFDWSPDGRYLAYSVAVNRRRTAIRIYDTQEECVHPVTEPILSDTCPVFDPEGKYLYFLSYREFDPVQDDVHFDLGFPRGARPYLATLRKETPDPLLPREEEETSRQGKGEPGDGDAPESLGNDREDAAGVHASSSPAVEIDFEGISERIVPLPVPLGRYWALAALPKRLLFLEAPIKGMLGRGERPDQCLEASLTLKIFDLTKQRTQTLITGISAFHLAANRKKLCYRKENRLRVVPAGEPIEKKGSAPGGEEGWIALEQLSVGVEPALEWRQLYREAWRLQRDYFWNEEMSAVDWEAVYERYLPLLDRISTRSECSDLLWEMQGE
ncbi:MAG: peptidase, partial [Deltaproteobacteria bacterium]